MVVLHTLIIDHGLLMDAYPYWNGSSGKLLLWYLGSAGGVTRMLIQFGLQEIILELLMMVDPAGGKYVDSLKMERWNG